MTFFVGFEDNWKPSQTGGIHNHHLVIQGDPHPVNVVREGNNHIATLKDGRKYQRPIHYYEGSPYGWKLIHLPKELHHAYTTRTIS